MKKRVKSIFIRQCIETLLRWNGSGKDRAFLIVICDKEESHVAWQNLSKLAQDGAIAVSATPTCAAMWETLQTGVDILTDGLINDPEWLKGMQELPEDKTTWKWEFFNQKTQEGGYFA